MRKVCILAVVLLLGTTVYADLQNVQVGGELRIRFRGHLNYENGPAGPGPGGSIARMPATWAPGRSIGAAGFQSRFRFDDYGNDRYFTEMLTRLNVTANFTDKVSGEIDLDSYDIWGEDFRSNYITGVDARANTNDDLEVIQSYIQAEEMFGYPLRLRVGRQQMKFGKGWLVGDRYASLSYLSFDGVRLTYSAEDIAVDAWWTKLAEAGAVEEDGDTDFYGIYGTYSGLKPLKISAYWMWVRDGEAIKDTNTDWFTERLEDLFNVDDYDVTNLHTVGVRLWGAAGGFDYDLEAAYQFGNASQVGALFVPVGGVFGDDDAEWDNWAADLEVGYTFDVKWKPRVYVGGAYYEGEDNRDISFWEWLCPFDLPHASVSFNRLFPDTSCRYADILDTSAVLTNFKELRAGVDLQPTEKIKVRMEVEEFWVDDPFDLPVMLDFGTWKGNRLLLPILPEFSFWTKEASDDIGVLTTLTVKYAYSKDLSIEFLWEHLFTGEGILDGNFIDRYGLFYFAGANDDDADRIQLMFALKF